MSKILSATCQAGVVTVEGQPIPGTRILSEGVAASEGVFFLERDEPTYVAKTSGDLKTTLEAIASALGQLVTALTAIDAKPVGVMPPAPVASAQITQLSALQTQLTTLKGAMK